jgi:hypothetical protein
MLTLSDRQFSAYYNAIVWICRFGYLLAVPLVPLLVNVQVNGDKPPNASVTILIFVMLIPALVCLVIGLGYYSLFIYGQLLAFLTSRTTS